MLVNLPTLCGFSRSAGAVYDSALCFHGGYVLFRVTDKDLRSDHQAYISFKFALLLN